MPPVPNLLHCAAVIAVFAAFFWAQDDDARTTGNPPAAVSEADRQDAEALSSREWAGQRVCGPNATAVWESDKTLTCLRHIDKPVRVAGGRP